MPDPGLKQEIAEQARKRKELKRMQIKKTQSLSNREEKAVLEMKATKRKNTI